MNTIRLYWNRMRKGLSITRLFSRGAELEKIQKGDGYRLSVIKDVFLQPPEPKRWERRQF